MVNAGYEARSDEALERSLYRARAYAPWRSLDPVRSAGVEKRHACLPATDKGLIRRLFPEGLVPAGKDLAGALRSGLCPVMPISKIRRDWHRPLRRPSRDWGYPSRREAASTTRYNGPV